MTFLLGTYFVFNAETSLDKITALAVVVLPTWHLAAMMTHKVAQQYINKLSDEVVVELTKLKRQQDRYEYQNNGKKQTEKTA